jgi:hypothetical protein
MTKRKKRSDRNHIIYQIILGATGQTYIGMTQCTGRAIKRSVTARWKRHVSRATHTDLTWPLCEAIRQYGPTAFTIEPIHIIRGKAEAHILETQIIREKQPELNLVSITKNS